LRRISDAFEERAISIYSQRFAECVEKRFDLSAFDLIHAHGMYTPAGLIAQILSQEYSKRSARNQILLAPTYTFRM
jgi:hypothetical protein